MLNDLESGKSTIISDLIKHIDYTSFSSFELKKAIENNSVDTLKKNVRMAIYDLEIVDEWLDNEFNEGRLEDLNQLLLQSSHLNIRRKK